MVVLLCFAGFLVIRKPRGTTGGAPGVATLAKEENLTVMENGDAVMEWSTTVPTFLGELYQRSRENLGEEVFSSLLSEGMREEQLMLNGVEANVSEVKTSVGPDNLLRVEMEAYCPGASRFNAEENVWEIRLGQRLENGREGAGFILMQMMFAQMMLRSIPGEQIFEYVSTLPIRLPAGASLSNAQELSGRTWRIDFGGGNRREASLSVLGPDELLLTERVIVTEKPPDDPDGDLFSSLREYRSFTVKYRTAGQGAPHRQGEAGEEVGSGPDFSWKFESSLSCPFEVTLASGTFSHGGSSVSAEVVLSGKADFEFGWCIGWDFEWEWTGWWWEYKLQWFKAYLEIDPSVEVCVSAASGELSQDWSQDLYAWSHPVTVFIGPVPVVLEVRADVDGGVELGVSGDLSLDAGVKASAEYRAGVQWTKSKGWEPIAEQSYSLIPVGPDIEVSASASVTPYLQLRLGAYFYYTVGPFVGLKPLATANLTPSPENWTLEAGFDVEAGVGFGAISDWIDLPDWSATLYSWRIPIAAGSLGEPPGHSVRETGHSAVYPVDVAGGGEHFIAVGRAGGGPDRLYLFSKVENQPLWHKDHVWTAAISPDGSYVVAGGASYFNPKVSLLSSSGGELWSYDVGSYPAPVDVSRGARTIAAIGSSGGETALYLFSGDHSTPLQRLPLGPEATIGMVRVSANGDFIAAYVQNGEFRRLFLFYRDSPVPVWTYDLGGFGTVSSLDISGDGTYVAAVGALAGFSEGVYLFSRLDNVPLWVFRTPGEHLSEVALSGGRYLVAGSYREVASERRFEGKVRLFSTEDNRPLWTYGVSDAVFAVGISEDGRWVCAGTSGGKLYEFLAETGEPLWEYTTLGFAGAERQIGVFTDGYVVAGGSGGRVYLFEP